MALAVTWAGPQKLWHSISTLAPVVSLGMLALLLLNILGTYAPSQLHLPSRQTL